MAKGGEEEIPLTPMTEDQDYDDDDDDDDDDLLTHDSDQENGETTQPFQPGPTSTPYPEGEQSGLPNVPDLTQRLQQTRANSAWNDLTEMYGNANKSALEAFYEKDKKGNPRLCVKMVGKGTKAYPLFTKNSVTRQLRENPQLSQEIKSYLGKSMFDQMNDYQAERNKNQ